MRSQRRVHARVDIVLDGHPRIHALAGDTVGAGVQEDLRHSSEFEVFLTPDSLERLCRLSLRSKNYLTNNNRHVF